MGADGVVVDVAAMGLEVGVVADAVVGEAALPDGEVGREAVGEAAFDVADGSGEVVGGEQEVDVVGHDDEGVEFEEALVAVVLEGFDKEFGVGGELEEAAALVGDGGDEESAGGGGSWRLGHVVSLVGRWALRTAFGRAEGPAARAFLARLKPGPSGLLGFCFGKAGLKRCEYLIKFVLWVRIEGSLEHVNMEFINAAIKLNHVIHFMSFCFAVNTAVCSKHLRHI